MIFDQVKFKSMQAIREKVSGKEVTALYGYSEEGHLFKCYIDGSGKNENQSPWMLLKMPRIGV